MPQKQHNKIKIALVITFIAYAEMHDAMKSLTFSKCWKRSVMICRADTYFIIVTRAIAIMLDSFALKTTLRLCFERFGEGRFWVLPETSCFV